MEKTGSVDTHFELCGTVSVGAAEAANHCCSAWQIRSTA